MAAARRRIEAHVGRHRHGDLRPCDARAADARAHRGDRGRIDPRRSRRGGGGSHCDRDGRGPLPQSRRGEGGAGARGGENHGAGGAAARAGGCQAIRDPGDRRQRLRQDHHRRQARGEIPCRRQDGAARRLRHVSRRRHRSAEDLGRPLGYCGADARAGRRRRRPRLRRARRGARRGDRRTHGRHRRPPAEQGRV